MTIATLFWWMLGQFWCVRQRCLTIAFGNVIWLRWQHATATTLLANFVRKHCLTMSLDNVVGRCCSTTSFDNNIDYTDTEPYSFEIFLFLAVALKGTSCRTQDFCLSISPPRPSQALSGLISALLDLKSALGSKICPLSSEICPLSSEICPLF